MPDDSPERPRAGPTHRVLIVEADHGFRDLLARGLREHGLAVLTAVNGHSAIRILAAHRVDAIVMAVGLPDTAGRDVCARRAGGFTLQSCSWERPVNSRIVGPVPQPAAMPTWTSRSGSPS